MANHNWYIGQDVVCIKSHSMGLVKEGEIFTIQSLRKCCRVSMQVGVRCPNESSHCGKCYEVFCPSSMQWFSETLFAPLDTLTDISEIEEILKQPIETLYQL